MLPPVEVTEESVRELLRSLCIPVNLRGYEYLVRALRISSNNQKSTPIGCKDLYEMVKAELSLNISVKSVETSIREAVAKALPTIPEDEFKKVFGASKAIICRGKSNMPNAVFIHGSTQYLIICKRRLKYEELNKLSENN